MTSTIPKLQTFTMATRTLNDLFPTYFSNQSHVTLPLAPQKGPASSCLRTLTHAVPTVWNAILSTLHILDSFSSFWPQLKAISLVSFPDTLS